MKHTTQLYIILLCLFFLVVGCSPKAEADNTLLRYNQAGYHPEAPKAFVVADSKETRFKIINQETGAVAFKGKLTDRGLWTDSGEVLKEGDFSSLSTPGTYRIKAGQMESAPFIIGESAFTALTDDLLNFLTLQRASAEITAEQGGDYARKSGHPDTDLTLHVTTGKTGKWSSPGGWYDAGDYGKYIVNGGITTATLLGLCEVTGGGTGPLLTEIKYELDWFKTMQDSDGGVFFKVAAVTWNNGWKMPDRDTNPRYVIGKSTTPTLNFAAAMAQASRVFAGTDPAYADDCRERARLAWLWAGSNPSVRAPEGGNANGGSGQYGDTTYRDEFFWAACELYAATGEAAYAKYIDEHPADFRISGPADWSNTANLGILTLAMNDNGPYQAKARKTVTEFADTILERIEKSPCRIPMQTSDFVWGSNGVIGNYGVILGYAWVLTGDPKYRAGMIRIADYLLGKNGTGYCFITGYGYKRVMSPHHRISANDGISDPVPGMVAGGPNPGKQDGLSSYPSTLPARCYVDESGSYASNETAINWNAPAYFLFSILEENKTSY
jgi:endoglucanase